MGDLTCQFRALAYYRQNKLDLSIQEYNKALSFPYCPLKFGILYDRGNCYVKMNDYLNAIQDYNEAILDYTRAIEIDPKEHYNYNNRGFCYMDIDCIDKAIKDFDKVIEIDPKYYIAFVNRADCYLRLKKYEKALWNYNKAIEINPSFIAAYNSRGGCYDQMGKHEEAIKDFNRVIQIKPSHYVAYNNRGLCYKRMEQYETALKDLLIASKLSVDIQKNLVYTIKQLKGTIARKSKEKKCLLCNKEVRDIKQCSGCKGVLYCSRKCQVLDWKEHKYVCSQTVMKAVCSFCDIIKVKTRKCCLNVRYCSDKCQIADWSEHKKVCIKKRIKQR